MIKKENIRNSYKTYKESTENPVDFATYLNIAYLYVSFLMEKVLKGYEVTLPSNMGTLEIRGTKEKITIDENGEIKGLSPNWKKTFELWNSNPEAKEKKKLVYNTNEHSSNIRYRFVWRKSGSYTTNKTLYSLKISRANKRLLGELIKNGKEYYNG